MTAVGVGPGSPRAPAGRGRGRDRDGSAEAQEATTADLHEADRRSRRAIAACGADGDDGVTQTGDGRCRARRHRRGSAPNIGAFLGRRPTARVRATIASIMSISSIRRDVRTGPVRGEAAGDRARAPGEHPGWSPRAPGRAARLVGGPRPALGLPGHPRRRGPARRRAGGPLVLTDDPQPAQPAAQLRARPPAAAPGAALAAGERGRRGRRAVLRRRLAAADPHGVHRGLRPGRHARR